MPLYYRNFSILRRQFIPLLLRFLLIAGLVASIGLYQHAGAYFFKDVQGHWSADYFEKLHTTCGINGKTNEAGQLLYLASPDEFLTREQLVQIMAKCLNKPLSTPATNPFWDVDRLSWAGSAVFVAKQEGWTYGYGDGSFGLGRNVRRDEALAIMLRAYFDENKMVESNKDFFVDVMKGTWARPYIDFAFIKDFVHGLGNADGSLQHRFGPELNMTRGEAAKIIVKIIEFLKDHENDINDPYTTIYNTYITETDTDTDTDFDTDTDSTNDNTTDSDSTNNNTNTGTTDSSQNDTTYNAAAANSHPSMWFTTEDVPRLRSWAVSTNPVYQQGLKVVAETAKKHMDTGLLEQDTGKHAGNMPYPREIYAMLFAFMANIENDQAVRDDYAQRARTQLMYIMDEAAKGFADGQPFRDPRFPRNDRAHFWGEAYALTVDWIYPYLSAQDKATIRKVFLMWQEEIIKNAYTHPDTKIPLNDPGHLYLDEAGKRTYRFGMNNHFTLFTRQVGMMAMALDLADDPSGELRSYLENATGAWLYRTHHLIENDANPSNDSSDPYNGQSGDWHEGCQYTPSGLGNTIHLLLAMKTKGLDDASLYGDQVKLLENSYFKNIVTSYLHSMSPVRSIIEDYEWFGLSYMAACYGDFDQSLLQNAMKFMGPLGLYYSYVGDDQMYNKIRWVETNIEPGGKDQLLYRITSTSNSYLLRNAIFAFMLFDPNASEPADPRPSMPTTYFGKSMNRILSRTGWDPINNSENHGSTTRWFTYKLSWNKIDHQHADGNMFEFYRKGEWLTKNRIGYGYDVGSSSWHNTITVFNSPPAVNNEGSYQNVNWDDGSQWLYISSGDPVLVAKALQNNYIFVTGDATNLYNSAKDGATDVEHVSRSLLWMKPDHIVVYDRVASKSTGKFKRFWLNLQNVPVINGTQTTATTPKGQKLFIKTLLPLNATITSDSSSPTALGYDEDAQGEIMQHRLKVEATGAPQSTRFLHVLQGADAGASPDNTSHITSSDGSFDGAIVGNTAVLFAVNLNNVPNSFTYTVPSNVSTHYITGLTAKGSYTVSTQNNNGNKEITVTLGNSTKADDGGVLIINN